MRIWVWALGGGTCPRPCPSSSPWWPSGCWGRSLGWSAAGCWSGPSPAPAPCSCSGCSWWGRASSPPASQSLQAACSGCRPPHQRPCRLRIWRLRLKSGSDQRHGDTEDGWDGGGQAGLTVYHFFEGEILFFSCFWLELKPEKILMLRDYSFISYLTFTGLSVGAPAKRDRF